MTWEEAHLTCRRKHADLASITSEAERTFAFTLAGSQTTWIGANDRATDGTFVWSDGTSWDRTQMTRLWAGGEPNDYAGNEDCVNMRKEEGFDGLLNDSKCNGKFAFVCKAKSVRMG